MPRTDSDTPFAERPVYGTGWKVALLSTGCGWAVALMDGTGELAGSWTYPRWADAAERYTHPFMDATADREPFCTPAEAAALAAQA